MVGDLVEIERQKGKLWFWLSVAGVALSLFWRRPIAFVVAFFAAAWMFGRFEMAIIGMNAQHRPPEFWMPVFNILWFVGSILWAVSLYAAIRYGLQERSAQLALGFAGLVTAVIYLWWLPAVLVACIAAALVIATASVLNGKLRKEMLVVLVAVSLGYVALYLAMFPVWVYQHSHWIWGSEEMRAHSVFWGWLDFCVIVLSLWATTTAWSRMRGWLMRSQSLESRSEML